MDIERDEKNIGQTLGDRFAVVERRIQSLLDRNKALRDRISELEQELARAQNASRELERHQTIKRRLKEKIEGILRTLESASLNK